MHRSAMTAERKPIAVVTASTAGIGLAAAFALAKQGMHVIVSSRGAENVEKSVKLINDACGLGSASGIPCHVGQPEDRAALLAFALSKGSSIQALVLNAAVSTAHGNIFNITEEQWDKMFDINVKAAFFLVKEFEPSFTNTSSVVFITSIAAYSAIPGLGAYSITKTALLGMCKVLSIELARKGIRVNAVAPGLIKTKFSEKLWKTDDNSEASSTAPGGGMLAKFFHVPLNRIGVPEDIGGIVAFLVSDQASYITGETIVVAGGAMSKL